MKTNTFRHRRKSRSLSFFSYLCKFVFFPSTKSSLDLYTLKHSRWLIHSSSPSSSSPSLRVYMQGKCPSPPDCTASSRLSQPAHHAERSAWIRPFFACRHPLCQQVASGAVGALFSHPSPLLQRDGERAQLHLQILHRVFKARARLLRLM